MIGTATKRASVPQVSHEEYFIDQWPAEADAEPSGEGTPARYAMYRLLAEHGGGRARRNVLRRAHCKKPQRLVRRPNETAQRGRVTLK